MGQYYRLLNINKKEKLEIDHCHCGKLVESTFVPQYQNALLNLLVAEWKGDTIVLLGDYADDVDDDSIDKERISFIKDKMNYQNLRQEYPHFLSGG